MSTVKSIKINEQLSTNTKPYYLGLDVGTSTIGYAVSDKNYNIIKKGRKALWGVRLFQEAQTAAGRREHRSSRRNKNRRNYRIKLLQEYFAHEINKKDPSFFLRLKESFYYPEDKSIEQPNTLFNDLNYTDKDYHEKFPTIYHLRQSLCQSNEKHDIREVYLAIAHIMKHRGHFLMEDRTINFENQFKTSFDKFESLFKEYYESSFFNEENKTVAFSTLLDQKITPSDKVRLLSQYTPTESNFQEYLKLLVGNLANLDKLFFDESLKELEHNKLKFSDNGIDDKLESLSFELDERFDLIEVAYEVYNSLILQNLLSDNDGNVFNSISDSRVNIYNQHSEDLKTLKSIIRDYDVVFNEDVYRKVFVENEKNVNNYVAYTKHVDSRDEISAKGHCNQVEFLSFIKKYIQKLHDHYTRNNDEENIDFLNDVLGRINLETFMPMISSTSNRVIPYQLHLFELDKILNNAKNHYQFLTSEVISEIKQIFTFKIPYFVGPFDTRSDNAWIVRKSFESIKPWNMTDIIDLDKTEEMFIRRMTNKCTYLIGEDVLPKDSLLYSEFMVKNALNVLTIDGNRLDKETRDYLFEDLFEKRSSSGAITRKRIVSSLKKHGIIVSENSINGMDNEIPFRMKAYQDFKRILTKDELKKTEIEEIIERLTIFSEGASSMKHWLQSKFDDRLNNQQINQISKLKYSGWGRLSKKLLTGFKHTLPNQREVSIIDYMTKEPRNLMEILFDDSLSFGKQIESHNDFLRTNEFEITEEYLDNLYISPSVKKAIRQTVHLINEIFSIMGGAPEKIFIEMAREQGEKTRTVSRKNKINNLYRSLSSTLTEFKGDVLDVSKKGQNNWREAYNELNDEVLKRKKLYLYYMQWGRCMYTGSEIILNKLFDNNFYDIDHIYPRSLTKDDSWDNLVLVTADSNRIKGDCYPIHKDIRTSRSDLWRALHNSEFISTEKYNRLKNHLPLSKEQLEGFINRQLVETRQSTKALATILKDVAKKSDVIYVKANHISDFRYFNGMRDNSISKFYFPKVRDLNDYHHAKDAYLNIVVGNAYHMKFTSNFYILKDGKNRANYNLVKMFDREIKNGEEIIWAPGPDGTIKTVRKMMRRNNVLISVEAYKQKGEFFDLQLVKKGLGQFPIKTSSNEALLDINKYGGYNKVSGSHFCLIKHMKRNKFILTFASVPIVLNSNDNQSLIEYFKSQGFVNPTIIKNNILYKSIVEIDGIPYRLFGKSGANIKCSTIEQGNYNTETVEYFKYLERILNKNVEPEEFNEQQLFETYKIISNKLKTPPFSNYSSLKNQGEFLDVAKDSFNELTILERIRVLFNSLRLLRGRGESADLSSLFTKVNGRTGGKQLGVIAINSNHDLDTKIRIVSHSITGFFENSQDINS